jgi:hypothetical protein
MGKFSYKKRKGTRKQSFKNRKRVKKGGTDHENKNEEDQNEAAANTQEAVDQNEAAATVDQNEAAATVDQNEAASATIDNTNQNAAAATTIDNTNQNAAVVDQNKAAENTQEEVTGVDAAGTGQAGDAQTGETDTNANEAGNENPVQDWKEGQSEEDIKQAEEEVSAIEGKANAEGELDPEEINNLVNQLAEGKDVPLWAKALAKSGAAGTAAKILNKNPALRDALMKKGIDVINNADVSMAPGSASAPGAQNTGTGAPGANTGAAAPGGSYTADDAGYQIFVQKVQSDPGVLKNVVYVNDQMTQIFLKKSDGWIEIK